MNKKGFTLVEIMVAVTIFAVVMVISMDIFLKSFASQRRIIEMQKLQREGFYVMEIMSRKIRMATIIEPQSLDHDESVNQDSSFYFTNSDGEEIEFCRSDEDGICNDDDTGDYLAFGLESQVNKDLAISSDVKVENLRFYVSPEGSGKSQYVVTIDLDLVSTKNSEVKIDLQSSISTRIYSDGVIAGDSSYCGDGVVQDPNGDAISEVCDDGDATHGGGNTDTPCDPGCSDNCTYCDTSCQSHTVNRDTDWIIGVCSGIGVYYEDVPYGWEYGPRNQDCICSGVCDSDRVLIPTATFFNVVEDWEYTIPQYCQSLGGRLPTPGELECMYANKDNIGGFQDSVNNIYYYWSNKMEMGDDSYYSITALKMDFYDGGLTGGYRDNLYYARCVKDTACYSGTNPNASTCGNGVTDWGDGEECDWAEAAYSSQPAPYPIDNRDYYRDDVYCSEYCTKHFVNNNSGECRDGTLEPLAGEECDDGNGTNGDGCEYNCTLTPGLSVCGNGTKEVGETCDDGNLIDGDGCESDCTVSPFSDPCTPSFTLIDEYDKGKMYNTIWTDLGDDIYTANYEDHNLEAFTFDGSTLTRDRYIDSSLTVFGVLSIWSDGTYVYTSNMFDTFGAFDQSFTQLDYNDDYAAGGDWLDMWGDGSYVYTTIGSSQGIKVWSFDGSNLVEEGGDGDILMNAARGVWGDGSYVYVADSTKGVVVYDSFDGSSLNRIYNLNNTYINYDIWGDGTYIYVAARDRGVLAYSFDGSTLTLEGEVLIGGNTQDVWYYDGYIFVVSDKLYAYQFNGSSFTEIDSIAVEGGIWGLEGVMGDGTYIYVVGGDGLKAYSFD